MKPQPKREIAIEERGDRHLIIYTGSPDALSWLLDNGDGFGSMFELNGCYCLHVSPVYDTQEVIAHIRALGVPDTDDLAAFDIDTAPASATGGNADGEEE